MRSIRYLFILIVHTLLSILLFGFGYVHADSNPYMLISNDDIGEIYKEDVQAHWNENGTRGNFRGIDGVNIEYMTFVIRPSKAAVVISSGRTESFIKYKELIYDLNRNNYSVFIHDHRGQGLSGRMTEHSQMGYVKEFDHYIDDLHRFITTVVSENEFHRHFLLAHSMGGAIASLYLEKYDDIFDAAVLSSPMHEPDTGLIPAELACAITDFKNWFGREKEYAPKKGPYEDNLVFNKRIAAHIVKLDMI